MPGWATGPLVTALNIMRPIVVTAPIHGL